MFNSILIKQNEQLPENIHFNYVSLTSLEEKSIVVPIVSEHH